MVRHRAGPKGAELVVSSFPLLHVRLHIVAGGTPLAGESAVATPNTCSAYEVAPVPIESLAMWKLGLCGQARPGNKYVSGSSGSADGRRQHRDIAFGRRWLADPVLLQRKWSAECRSPSCPLGGRSGKQGRTSADAPLAPSRLPRKIRGHALASFRCRHLFAAAREPRGLCTGPVQCRALCGQRTRRYLCTVPCPMSYLR